MASRVLSPVPAGVAIPRIKFPEKIKRNGFWKGFRLRQVPLKRVPIKRESKGHKAEVRKYRKVSAEFLARPENAWCICCTLRRERLGENILRNQSVEIHHWAGRIGRLLCYVPYFRAFCNACRRWPHEHPSLARELNLLAPPKLWNHFPGNGS